jgi:succinate-semialdehyde dehydrogenase/glutarate-semialdehyde dehydrogenase
LELMDVSLFVAGDWQAGSEAIAVLDPATGAAIGSVARAAPHQIERAAQASAAAFNEWRATSAFERSKVLRRAADILRGRIEPIAELLTREQGKVIAEARAEVTAACDIIEWFAEEGRRAYGRLVPARAEDVEQLVLRLPVGPSAAFTPWNFPVNQAVRKIAGALAAGCSIIVKGPEETPASCAELVRAFAEAGLPAGSVNLLFGVPSEISEYLIPHPAIRKISFTGSTAVGKRLAALAGQHMKRMTMELGGHAPAIVFEDADLEASVRDLAAMKFRNAGQVCVAPSRFIIHEEVHDTFLERFAAAASAIKVGSGLDPTSTMGPLANQRRVEAMDALVSDAVGRGARLVCGGRRLGNEGFFFAPTVLADVPVDARVMNEEPFGPIAAVTRFGSDDEAIAEANRLAYGLAAYAYTRSAKRSGSLPLRIESGMLSINHYGLALPEVPFGGTKESGHGSEGGQEGLEAYLETRFVSRRTS